MSKWRPIETAPKDGTMVLLYDGNCSRFQWRIVTAYWQTAYGEPEWKTIGKRGSFRTPSHWMPLPEPPRRKCKKMGKNSGTTMLVDE